MSASKLPFTTVCVCGGGNSAHTTVGYLASKGIRVRLLTRQPKTFSDSIKVTTEGSAWADRGPFVGRIERCSDDAADVVPGAQLVILAAPAHAAGPILARVAPHIDEGAWVATVFGQGGFDWAAQAAFGIGAAGAARAAGGAGSRVVRKPAVIFALLNIPWITIKQEHGKHSRIAGPKTELQAAAWPNTPEVSRAVCAAVQGLFDIPCKSAPNFLSITLTPSNQIIHPARYYAIFKDWDGKRSYSRAEVPLTLYKGFDDAAGEHLAVLDNELQQIKWGLLERYPELDLSLVTPIAERVVKGYGSQVRDTSSVRAVFDSNLGYEQCKTPVEVQADGSLKPAVKSRLFWEDMPYGLCILKNMAQLMRIPTPRIDMMLAWHQRFMGVELLDTKTRKLNPATVGTTGAPAAYGINSLDEMVAMSLPAGALERGMRSRL